MEDIREASQSADCGRCSDAQHPGCAMRFLSPDELATIIETAVLVDVRPFSDFTVGHIRGAVSVRLSSILIRRLASGKISCVDIVVDEQKESFRKLTADPARVLVVYDENAPCAADKATLLADNKSPLAIVAKSLCRSFPAVAVLQGSFSAFKAAYPQLLDSANGNTDMGPSMGLLSPLAAAASATELVGERSPCERSVRDLAPSEILPFLFVGSQSHAQSREIMESFGFTHVLNITSTCPNWFPNTIVYKIINIRDTWNQNITSYFDEAFQFIESAKQSNGKVLVHCVAGISRSPTITIAYLMKTNGWTLCEALAFVKSKRTIVCPNLDFLVELQCFERQLFPGLGFAPPVISPDTQILLGPGYPCAALCPLSCSSSLVVPPAPVAAASTSAAMETDSVLCAPTAAPCSPVVLAAAHAAAMFTAQHCAEDLPPSTPWVMGGGSASSLLVLPPSSLSTYTSASGLAHSSVSPAEVRVASEPFRRGSASEGCSPRLKSPFQVSLSVTVARTSPKAPRRDPQSPFVSSPSSQGIFVL